MMDEEITKHIESMMPTPQAILNRIDKEQVNELEQIQQFVNKVTVLVLARVHEELINDIQDMSYQYQQGVSAENIADEFMVRLGLQRE